MKTINSPYTELKNYIDKTINKDKSLYVTSNDEPTPLDCVEEMISRLPPSIFKNRNLEVFDPCCGNGNFFIPLYFSLLQYHKPQEIVEKMLHFNDINEDRLAVVKQIFGVDGFKTNITNYDFLSNDIDNKLYDLIMCNPPYAKFSKNGNRASKNHNLVGDFIDRSLRKTKPGGYLLFIVPNNWMSYSRRNKLITQLTELQFHYLNIHTAKKYFKHIGSSFTWFVLQNKKFYKPIQIEGIWKNKEYTSMVNSQVRKYIPLFYNKLIQSIINKTLDAPSKKFLVETTSDLHRHTKKKVIQNHRDEEYRHRLIHTPSQTCWSKIPHKYQKGYKVFISLSSYYKVFVDNCGMTQSIAFIRCENKKEAEGICDTLKHPLYVFLNDICRYGNFNNVLILKSFPYVNSRTDVYNTLHITKTEQLFIEQNFKYRGS